MRLFRTESAQETVALGARFGRCLDAGVVVLLTGDLGAGKTQFAQGVAAALGVCEPVVSPTFNILLVHEGDQLVLHHWDLYRLNNTEELVDVDYFAQVASDAVSLVEWGDKFADTRLDADMEVRFLREGDNVRTIEAMPLSERGDQILAAIRQNTSPDATAQNDSGAMWLRGGSRADG